MLTINHRGKYDCDLFRLFLLNERNERWAIEELQDKATLSALDPIKTIHVECAPASFHAEESQERRALEWE